MPYPHISLAPPTHAQYKDMEHFKKYLAPGLDVRMEYLGEQQLVALQGKGAAIVLARLAPSLKLSSMSFMTGTTATVSGIEGCRVTRCGYTGEDGFEISVDPKNAVALAEALLKQPEVKPSGLGARDSLRLEAGLCLYGNDLDESINPVQGALTWTIGGPKSRRRIEQGFLGASTFLEKDGKLKPQDKKRVGLSGMKAPARGHTPIFTADGKKKIGEITSGGFGPSYGKALAMGYVESASAADGTEVAVEVRGKMMPCQVTKTPFVPTSYFKA